MTMNGDFTIECQARDDITLANLDMDKFAIMAQAASTPFDTRKTVSYY